MIAYRILVNEQSFMRTSIIRLSSANIMVFRVSTFIFMHFLRYANLQYAGRIMIDSAAICLLPDIIFLVLYLQGSTFSLIVRGPDVFYVFDLSQPLFDWSARICGTCSSSNLPSVIIQILPHSFRERLSWVFLIVQSSFVPMVRLSIKIHLVERWHIVWRQTR